MQAEATKWKDRGKQLFKEKRFVLLIEYYTLAIKYVPSNDREFLATLLCNRALAYYNTHQYQHSLEDAKSCSKFRSDWFKVSRERFAYMVKIIIVTATVRVIVIVIVTVTVIKIVIVQVIVINSNSNTCIVIGIIRKL